MREVTLAMAAAAAEVPPDQLCENFCLRPSHLAGALYLHCLHLSPRKSKQFLQWFARTALWLRVVLDCEIANLDQHLSCPWLALMSRYLPPCPQAHALRRVLKNYWRSKSGRQLCRVSVKIDIHYLLLKCCLSCVTNDFYTTRLVSLWQSCKSKLFLLGTVIFTALA